jgi:hypothetical protein
MTFAIRVARVSKTEDLRVPLKELARVSTGRLNRKERPARRHQMRWFESYRQKALGVTVISLAFIFLGAFLKRNREFFSYWIDEE